MQKTPFSNRSNPWVPALIPGASFLCPDLWSQNLDHSGSGSRVLPGVLQAVSGSTEGVPGWLYAVMGLGAGALVWWLIRSDKKRTEKMNTLVESLGGTFHKEATAEDHSLIAGSHLAALGSNRKMFNIIELPPAKGTVVFDFQYWQGPHAQHRITFVMTVVSLQSDKLSEVPPFVLRPENLGDKVIAAFGTHDINLPQYPEFSRKYLLLGHDEAAVRQLFTPRVIAFFEEEPGWFAEVSGDRLFAYRESNVVNPEEISRFLESRKRMLHVLVSSDRTGTEPY